MAYFEIFKSCCVQMRVISHSIIAFGLFTSLFTLKGDKGLVPVTVREQADILLV